MTANRVRIVIDAAGDVAIATICIATHIQLLHVFDFSAAIHMRLLVFPVSSQATFHSREKTPTMGVTIRRLD